MRRLPVYLREDFPKGKWILRTSAATRLLTAKEVLEDLEKGKVQRIRRRRPFRRAARRKKGSSSGLGAHPLPQRRATGKGSSSPQTYLSPRPPTSALDTREGMVRQILRLCHTHNRRAKTTLGQPSSASTSTKTMATMTPECRARVIAKIAAGLGIMSAKEADVAIRKYILLVSVRSGTTPGPPVQYPPRSLEERQQQRKQQHLQEEGGGNTDDLSLEGEHEEAEREREGGEGREGDMVGSALHGDSSLAPLDGDDNGNLGSDYRDRDQDQHHDHVHDRHDDHDDDHDYQDDDQESKNVDTKAVLHSRRRVHQHPHQHHLLSQPHPHPHPPARRGRTAGNTAHAVSVREQGIKRSNGRASLAECAIDRIVHGTRRLAGHPLDVARLESKLSECRMKIARERDHERLGSRTRRQRHRQWLIVLCTILPLMALVQELSKKKMAEGSTGTVEKKLTITSPLNSRSKPMSTQIGTRIGDSAQGCPEVQRKREFPLAVPEKLFI